MTTLAEKILSLDDGKRSTREIAERVYGSATEARMAYVRVVLRQRKGRGSSEIDRRYSAATYAVGDRDAARKKKNQTYRLARKAGKSTRAADLLGWRAYACVLARTGRKTRAKARRSVDRTDAGGSATCA